MTKRELAEMPMGLHKGVFSQTASNGIKYQQGFEPAPSAGPSTSSGTRYGIMPFDMLRDRGWLRGGVKVRGK